MFKAAERVTAQNREKPLTTKWLSKPWYIILTMECYSAIKRNKLLTCAASHMEFKGIMMSENVDLKKSHFHDFIYM